MIKKFLYAESRISVNHSDKTREGRDFSSRAIIEFDPFPHRHFDSTSSFAKKRGFPHPPPLFPSRSSRCSLSLLVVTPPPSTSSPSPILLPPFSPLSSPRFSSSSFFSFSRASSLSRESRRLFLPRGCFIRRQKNIAAESQDGGGVPTRSLVTHPLAPSFPPPFSSNSYPRHCCREQERQNEPDC